MGFKEDKRRILDALRLGRVLHEDRSDHKAQNQLDAGELSVEEAAAILSLVRGTQAESKPHHFDSSVNLWILKPVHQGFSWYVKCYLDGEDLWMISFHLQEVQ